MRSLLAKEWRVLVRNRRFPALLFTVLLLVVASAGSSAWNAAVQTIERRQGAAEDYRRWIDQGEKYAHRAAHHGLYVFRAESVLTAFEPGITPYAGTAVWLEAHLQNAMQYRPVQDQTPLARHVPIAPGPLLVFLLPVLAALLGHGIVAEEGEQGTLRMAVLHAGGPFRLLATKVVVFWVILLIPVLVNPLVSLVVSHSLSLPAAADTGGRLAALLGIYAAYAGLWAVLTVALSAWIRRSGAVLTALIALWVLLVLIAPRVVAWVAQQQLPDASRAEFEHGLHVELDEADPVDRIEQLKARLLREHGIRRLDDLPQQWAGISYQEGEDLGNAVFDRHWRALYLRYEDQQTLVARLAWLSPAVSVQWLSQRLAGSDVWHQHTFVEKAETHRRRIQKTLNDELKAQRAADGQPVSDRRLWEKVPLMADAPPRMVEVVTVADAGLKAAIAGFAAVALAAAALLLLAGRRLERVG